MSEEIKNTLAERGSRYGTFEDNAETTQKLMEVVAKCPSFKNWHRAHKEAVHMIFHKIARMANGDEMYEDNPHDICGYSKLLEDYLAEKNSAKHQINSAATC